MKKQLFTAAMCTSILVCPIAAISREKRSEGAANEFSRANATSVQPKVATGPDTIIEQCANGGVGDPVQPCSGSNWTHGTVIDFRGHWVEGQSVPIRQQLRGFSPGASGNTVTLSWETTRDGKHAYDYLTSFDRTETLASGNNPCSDITGCSLGTFTTFPIPADPKVSEGHDEIPGNGDDVTQVPGVFTLFGGTITNVSSYTTTGSFAGNSQTYITITFTADQENMALAWGAHIGTRQDWGPENTTLFNLGFPYHMSLISCSFVCGAQDVGLGNSAVSILDNNYAPVNSVPGIQNTNQNTPLTFSSGIGNAISISDPDDSGDGTVGDQLVEMTLTVTHGALTLSAVSGLSFDDGDGTADTFMTFTGTINNVNVALNGMTFTPTAGYFGAASLQIMTNDLGNDGPGGNGNEMFDSDIVQISVNANGDSDNDGVLNNADLCSGTVLPEARPDQLKKNRFYAIANGRFVDAEGSFSGITLANTFGCSGSQILTATGAGPGQTKFGMARDVLLSWIATH